MAIKFSEIKKYLSRVVRLSICFEDGHYDNYTMLADIPEGKYDDLYVFGVGMVDVEFSSDVYSEPKEFPERASIGRGYFLGCGLEIVLTEKPRDIERCNKEELTFGDLRDYLQIGRNFSIVTRESWEEENYEWNRDIPEKYNNMYVYGIGIEDNPEELLKTLKYGLIDTNLAKKMRIVVL